MTQPLRYTTAPEVWDAEDLKPGPIEHIRKLGSRINALFKGKTNAVHLVTLEADETSTQLSAPDATSQTQVYLSPRSASAAAALASGTLWATAAGGVVTIHHDSSSDTDRTFGVALLG